MAEISARRLEALGERDDGPYEQHDRGTSDYQYQRQHQDEEDCQPELAQDARRGRSATDYHRRCGGRVTSRAGLQTCPHSWQRQYAFSLTSLLVVVTRADRQNGHDRAAGAGDETGLSKTLIAEPRV